MSRSRVTRGIPTGGQYATESRTETDLELRPTAKVCTSCGHRVVGGSHEIASDCTSTSTRDVSVSVDEVARYRADAYGATYPMIPSVERDIEESVKLAKAAGYDLSPDYLADVMAADVRPFEGRNGYLDGPLGYGGSVSSTATRIAIAHQSGMPVSWIEEMRERGPEWEANCVEKWSRGINAENLARLDSYGLADTPEMALAFADGDVENLVEWKEALADPEFSRYMRAHGGLREVAHLSKDGTELAVVQAAHKAGLSPHVARRGAYTPEGHLTGLEAVREVAAYKEACGLDEAHAMNGMADGVDPKAVKAFGPNIDISEGQKLTNWGVPPKVARSIRGRDRSISARAISQAHAAGITSGADYKEWGRVTGKHDHAEAVKAASSGVPLAVAQNLHAQGVPAEAFAAVHDAGITDMLPWARAVTSRTEHLTQPGTVAALNAIAAFTKAGGTPEQFTRAHAAGVTYDRIVAHVNSTPDELWEAGRINREAIMADERRLKESYGSLASDPQPWDK